jgi:hypothetical protein
MVLISSSFEPTKTIDDKLANTMSTTKYVEADKIDYSKRFIYGAIG